MTEAEIIAELNAIPLPKMEKRKPVIPRPAILVCVNGSIVGEAVVTVGPDDPNWWKGPKAVLRNGIVNVRPEVKPFRSQAQCDEWR